MRPGSPSIRRARFRGAYSLLDEGGASIAGHTRVMNVKPIRFTMNERFSQDRRGRYLRQPESANAPQALFTHCGTIFQQSPVHRGGHICPTYKNRRAIFRYHSVTAKGAMASMSLTQSMTTGLFALNAWSSALLSSPGFSTRMPSAPMDSAISAKFTSLSFQSS